MGTVKRTYDTRVSEIIARTGNADLFPEFDIPRSTRDSWVRRGPRAIIGSTMTSRSKRDCWTASPRSSAAFAY